MTKERCEVVDRPEEVDIREGGRGEIGRRAVGRLPIYHRAVIPQFKLTQTIPHRDKDNRSRRLHSHQMIHFIAIRFGISGSDLMKNRIGVNMTMKEAAR